MKFMNKILYDNKGLSLVELVIAMGLLGMVLSLAFMYFFFGSRTFRVGEAQSNLQRDIRLTSDFITRDVRYASELTLLDSLDTPLEDGYNYIYMDNSSIQHINEGGETNPKTEGVIEELSFHLKEVNEHYILEFHIEGRDDSQDYSQESEVVLINLQEGILEQNMEVLRYKKP